MQSHVSTFANDDNFFPLPHCQQRTEPITLSVNDSLYMSYNGDPVVSWRAPALLRHHRTDVFLRD